MIFTFSHNSNIDYRFKILSFIYNFEIYYFLMSIIFIVCCCSIQLIFFLKILSVGSLIAELCLVLDTPITDLINAISAIISIAFQEDAFQLLTIIKLWGVMRLRARYARIFWPTVPRLKCINMPCFVLITDVNVC